MFKQYQLICYTYNILDVYNLYATHYNLSYDIMHLLFADCHHALKNSVSCSKLS